MREEKVKVLVDTLEDLWYLSSVIDAGDFVYATSLRRYEEKEKQRKGRGEKKIVKIKLKVEDIEFHRSTDRLRISGTIESGSPEEYIDFGSHHTFNLELGYSIIIEKEKWPGYQLKILEDARKKSPKIVILSVDKGEAVFGFVKDYGVEYSRMTASIPGKDKPEEIEPAEKKFYSEVAESLERYEFEKLVLSGAGFYKDDLAEILKAKYPKIWEKVVVEHTGSSGENGIKEVLKMGLLHKMAEESKLAKETELIEKLLEEIGTEGKCTYGLDKVKDAAAAGAVETLLVTGKLLRENRKVGEVLKTVEKHRGKVLIVSTEHDSGKQLDSLGGIGALLRYRIE